MESATLNNQLPENFESIEKSPISLQTIQLCLSSKIIKFSTEELMLKQLLTYNKFFKLGIQLILICRHRDIHGHRLEWCPLIDPILDVGWPPSKTPAETLLTWHCQASVTEWLELSEHHLKKSEVLKCI